MSLQLQFDYTLQYDNLIISYASKSFKSNLMEKLKLEQSDQLVYGNVFRIYQLLEDVIDRNSDEYKLLFKPLYSLDNEEVFTLATLIDYGKQDKSFKSLLSTFSQLWDIELTDLNSLHAYLLDDNSLSFEFKYYLTLITQDEFKLDHLLNDFLLKFEIVKVDIERNYNEIVTYVKSYLTDKFVLETLNKHQVNFEVNSKFTVTLNLVLLNGISLMYHDHTEVGYISWGVFAKLSDEDTSLETQVESLMEVSKVLADATKLKILRFCLDEERYGSEIAKHVEVSGATISHHMAHLTSFNYVTVRVDTKRIYYKTNVDKILLHSSYVSELLNK